jgi:glycosyltransferase involved in cell wall biosynthesis
MVRCVFLSRKFDGDRLQLDQMTLRLAIVVSHPIQHFSPWHREVAKMPDIDLRVFFCCDWGTENYFDYEFQSEFKWDIPLLEGYEYEFLPIRRRPVRLNYGQVNNPAVGKALDGFDPDVVKIFGYSYRTNWHVATWTKRHRKPLLLYSDSDVRRELPGWKRLAKEGIVRRFYNSVDAALFVGDNNRDYHRHYGLPQERHFVGCLPIDQVQLRRAVPNRELTRRRIREEHGIPQDAFTVMFCGKYSPRKRPLDLVIASQTASKKGIPLWALLVGEGSERQKIEDYCRNNNLTNVTLTGFANQSKVPEYYAASDVLAVTSDDDPHPLVVSEAGTFGLPTIVSDRIGCIGVNDTARPGANAAVYPCGDHERLSQTMETLWRDRELYLRMSEAALKVSMSQDVGVAANQLCDAVKSLHEMGPR